MNYVKLILKVDMRTKSFDVPPQEILTKDSVTVTVDAVIYYKVRDANGKSYHTCLASQNMQKSLWFSLRSSFLWLQTSHSLMISLQKLQSKTSKMSILQLECLLKRH